MASIREFEELDDDKIHEFAIYGGKLLIKKDLRKHFELPAGKLIKHGYLIIDKSRIVSEGSNFPEEELKKFHGEIVII